MSYDGKSFIDYVLPSCPTYEVLEPHIQGAGPHMKGALSPRKGFRPSGKEVLVPICEMLHQNC